MIYKLITNKYSKHNQCNKNLKKKRRKKIKNKEKKKCRKRKDTLGQAAAPSSAQGASLSEGRPGRQVCTDARRPS